jgi:SPP1 family predicted phage head-tail adaptor
MQVGKLRKRVQLQQLVRNQDDFGEAVPSYSTYATVWASVEPLQGRELEHAQQINAEVSHRVTIRYNGNVTAEHRVVYGERILEIEAVINPEERNEMLVLMCKEAA